MADGDADPDTTGGSVDGSASSAEHPAALAPNASISAVTAAAVLTSGP